MRMLLALTCVVAFLAPFLGCSGENGETDAAPDAANTAEQAASAVGEAAEKVEGGVTTALENFKKEALSEVDMYDKRLDSLKDSIGAMKNDDLDKHVDKIADKLGDVRKFVEGADAKGIEEVSKHKEELVSKLGDVKKDFEDAKTKVLKLK
ncbi:hypothetical protein ACFL6M_00985 [Candidatus Eisenbacteria bacterium]|uniref:Uncharacterized protein n=1 Tax=Eiseniibacteriota bacterium TaxID=2212470 RepID=A0ABV6YIJ0_UNCEI